MPATKSHVPALNSEAFDCPSCGAFAHQTWADLYTWDQPSNSFYELNSPEGTWSTSTCSRCDTVAMWLEDRLIHPSGSTIPRAHAEMPESVLSLYNEGRDVWAISPRAGAALARAAVETLLKVLDPGKGTLEQRIERMLPHVSEGLGQMLTVVRHVGNKSVHPEDEPDDLLVIALDPAQTDVGALMFETVNDLVDERIARPARQANLFDRVPASVRERLPNPDE